jgi:cytochrome c556
MLVVSDTTGEKMRNEVMSERVNSVSLAVRSARAALVLGVGLAVSSVAQTPPPAATPPSPASQAIAVRKAIYTLVGANFKPIGDVLKGTGTADSAELAKSATRVAYLSGLAQEAFPDISSSGDTKAKPEIWTNRVDFDKRLKDFQTHAQALSQVAANEPSSSDAFKSAAGAVAQDCKGCHDNYRAK